MLFCLHLCCLTSAAVLNFNCFPLMYFFSLPLLCHVVIRRDGRWSLGPKRCLWRSVVDEKREKKAKVHRPRMGDTTHCAFWARKNTTVRFVKEMENINIHQITYHTGNKNLVILHFPCSFFHYSMDSNTRKNLRWILERKISNLGSCIDFALDWLLDWWWLIKLCSNQLAKQ